MPHIRYSSEFILNLGEIPAWNRRPEAIMTTGQVRKFGQDLGPAACIPFVVVQGLQETGHMMVGQEGKEVGGGLAVVVEINEILSVLIRGLLCLPKQPAKVHTGQLFT